MLTGLPILTVILFTPALGALLLLSLPSYRVVWLRYIAAAISALPLLLSMVLFISYQPGRGGEGFNERLPWFRLPWGHTELQFDYHLAVDGLSLPLVVLAALVFAISAAASFIHIKKRWKTYYVLFLVLQTCSFGLLLSRDVFMFVLFMETAFVVIYMLLGIWGGERKEEASRAYLNYSAVSSALLLLGLALLLGWGSAPSNHAALLDDASAQETLSGSYDALYSKLYSEGEVWEAPNLLSPDEPVGPADSGMADGLKWLIYVLLAAGFLLRLPVVPFHTWLLQFYRQAPPPVSMLAAGIMVQAGVYGLLRFVFMLFPEQSAACSALWVFAGLLNLLYGALSITAQTDLRHVAGYSMLSQSGVVLLGLGAMNEWGLTGGLFHLVSIGLVGSLMVLIFGSYYERTGTYDIGQLSGLARPMPYMSGLLMAAMLAAVAMPGLSGFSGTLTVLIGLFETMKGAAVATMLGLLLAGVALLRVVLNITYGPARGSLASLQDARLSEAVPMIVLLAFIILLGIYPSVLLDQMTHSFSSLLSWLNIRTGG
ncbi:complex I subunit 4 family protein [Paenibacillus sp. SYP-B4298]|uniref:complex I subunit 4 family protein n=1 Tax=Paenibacillus sp. SYP-B4298 TaxID=2996034 RepID=UPI0022DD345A|nr:NADH-quinone oxidoreductase subunit M [Paenibacillus sp. SYP-B4298]